MSLVHVPRCPQHGLHGEREECFVCNGPVEQVAMVPASEYDALCEVVRVLADEAMDAVWTIDGALGRDARGDLERILNGDTARDLFGEVAS